MKLNLSNLAGLLALTIGAAAGFAADNAAAQERDASPVEADSVAPVQQVAPPSPEKIPDIDPVALYGGDIVFDVYRKNSRVGEHRVSFQRDGKRLTVNVNFNLAVNFLFFRAYTFEYESTEIWEDGALIALTSLTDDNGTLSNVVARSEDGVFKIDGPRGKSLASSWVFPTNHWNRGQVASTTVLNTINGKLTRVEIVRKGIDKIETGSGSVDAERFVYTGELRDTDVWYAPDGRWVKMSFKAKDGSIIDYTCRQCGPIIQSGAQVNAVDMPDSPSSLVSVSSQ